jgi:fucose 4-O-acetylase-like acetyltransferase
MSLDLPLQARTSPAPQTKPARRRLDDIDRAKGLAIILVVFGHIVARGTPPGNEWYSTLKSAVYLFHMPFFIYLSGVVFTFNASERRLGQGFGAWVMARAERLLLPFLAFGVLIVVGKFAAARFLHVDDAPASIGEGLQALVLTTSNSPALSIWFMFVVFIYCVITPILIRLSNGRIAPWLAVAAILPFIEWPTVMYADRIARFYVFFLIGCLVGRRHEETVALFAAWRVWAYIAFAASFAVMPLDLPRSVKLLIVGSAAIPALHALVSSGALRTSGLLLTLGGFAFVIYLLNTITIGLAKAFLLKVLPWGGPSFPLVAIILFAAGLLVPIAVKVWGLRRFPRLNRMTD